MRWGLIPFFARGEPPKYSTINAMIEKLDVAPAWRGPWSRSRRCVMPAAGFYEWQVQPDGTTQPAGDDEVFSVAALWDRSRTESGEDVLSCAIITMPANAAQTREISGFQFARSPPRVATTESSAH